MASGSNQYLITFKGRTEEEVMYWLSKIGKKLLDEEGIYVEAVACFHKTLGRAKKGECYAMTYGNSRAQEDLHFLEYIEGITARQGRTIWSGEFIHRLEHYGEIEKFATVKPVEWYNDEQLVLYHEPTEEEVKQYTQKGIIREESEYLVNEGTMNSDDFDETKTFLPRRNPVSHPAWRNQRLPDYYGIPDGASIKVYHYGTDGDGKSSICFKYKEWDEPDFKLGHFLFEETFKNPTTKVILNSVANVLKSINKKGIKINYYQSYTPEAFESFCVKKTRPNSRTPKYLEAREN